MVAALRHRLAEGRIGQPWREECDRRAENRHRELLNVIGRPWYKNWPEQKPVDITYLRPLDLTPEEAYEEGARADRRKQMAKVVGNDGR